VTVDSVTSLHPMYIALLLRRLSAAIDNSLSTPDVAQICT